MRKTFSRPVAARQSRSACIVASVPEPVNRTMSAQGSSSQIRAARVPWYSVSKAHRWPIASASCTA